MRLTLSGVADARARLTPSDPMKSFERLAAREGATLRGQVQSLVVQYDQRDFHYLLAAGCRVSNGGVTAVTA